jgi:four helix bundle protein
MNEQMFRQRTKQFALRVIRVAQSLPNNMIADVISRQMVKAGTSVGANYRAACRAKSTADMIAKLQIVEEEADEAIYWLELIIEAKLMDEELLQPLMQEANEITAMIVSSIRTLQASRSSHKSKI